MAYLLDSNAFIQSKNLHYRFSFCPGYWDWIIAQHAAGNLLSVEKVSVELKSRADELSAWVTKEAPGSLFVPPVAAVVAVQVNVSRYVNGHGTYSAAEKARLLGKADPWLIAEASVNNHEIITFEELVGANSTKVKIPNVASQFGVRCVSLFDVLEQSGVQLRI